MFTEDPDTGCWLWTGHVLPNGYGQVWIAGKHHLVHRVMHEQEIGPIPEGMTVDHVHARGCRHKHCGNPAHLEAVTLPENIRRAAEARDCCTKGHEYTPENTRMRGNGRICRRCQADYKQRWQERQRMVKEKM
jgi:hypothetical protein